MSENAKTITFVVIGLLAVAIGVYSRPTSAELDEQTLVGQVLTKKFDSADEAKRLRIVRFDEDTATLREFEVAEQEGLWSIPSKSGYPADAARQMAEAATSLMDRRILAVASSNAGDHEEYGVIDPLSPKLEVGQKGVGTRVTMSDARDEPLADLVVGKAVKDAAGQRYVREAGRDVVYVIEIDPTKLSTNFEDWIEKDLLKLNSWDLQQVQIKDYSAEMHLVMGQDGRPGLGLSMDPRSEMTLAYNDSDAKWSAVKLQSFNPAKEAYSDFSLADGEELNSESLNSLKTALDDLQIVDVVRKPQGLSNDLKAGADFMNNVEALQDLVRKGFIPARAPGGSTAEELISSDGEVIATMKNGTEYVLRFGNLTNVGTEGQPSGQASEAEGDVAGNTKKDAGVHRYLFVMARFNEAAVKRPELQDLPELPAEAAATPANPTTGQSDTAQQSHQEAPAADSTSSEAPAAETSVPGSAGGSDAEPSASDSQTASTTKNATAADQPATDETKAADESSKTENQAAAAEAEKTKKLEELVAERKRIEQENTRKEDEYKQTLEKGREVVKDLNLRFGDWYFVVADDVFKKIRLNRENIVKKKEKKAEAAAGSAAGGETPAVTTPGTIPGLPEIPGASE
jgi:hypothetical protein